LYCLVLYLYLNVIGQLYINIQLVNETKRRRNPLNFTVSETYGEKPISEWLIVKVRDFVIEKYGLHVQISINPESMNRFLETVNK
jgi:hypothetical protein